MPPRKPAGAGGDDRIPALKLIMEKGPLSGQTYGFRPESLIQIGRLVRGNTLSIKDAGISSKHLLIQAETAPDPGRRLHWTVTDLGSSNGTVLNGVQLEPSEPAVIYDGDVIKIGEQTSITVKFEGNGVVDEASSGNVRRNARRRARNQVGDLGVIDEDSESGLGNNEVEEKIEEVAEVEVKQRRNVSTRRTRNSKKNESVLKDLNADENKDLGVIDEDSELRLGNNQGDEKIDKFAEVEVKRGRNASMRATRSSKKNESTLKDSNLEGDKDLGKGSQRVSGRRTRSSRKEEDVDEIGIDLSVVEAKRTRKGARGRKKLPVEDVLEETEKEEPKLEHKTCEEEQLRSEVEAKETCEEEQLRSEVEAKDFVEGLNSGRGGTAAGLPSTSGVKESNVETGKGEMVADLEKMTLGEWFDFLEAYLPKQIIDETEEMISEMRRKAERFHEFMLQQKNAKGKSEVAVD